MIVRLLRQRLRFAMFVLPVSSRPGLNVSPRPQPLRTLPQPTVLNLGTTKNAIASSIIPSGFTMISAAMSNTFVPIKIGISLKPKSLRFSSKSTI